MKANQTKIKIDLEDLRSEYESTYLHYFSNNEDYLTFKEWLYEYKNIDYQWKKLLLSLTEAI